MMDSKQNINLNMDDIAHHITLTVHLKTSRKFILRKWIALGLMKLVKMIMPFGVEVDTK